MRPFHRKVPREPLRVLVRHADAGIRRDWSGLDQWRGRSRLGHGQARELTARLDGLPITRVLSSPALRCRQTVIPLARELSLEVEPCRLLAGDCDPGELIRLLETAETENAVLCTHRETLLGVFGRFAMGVDGPRLIDGVARMEMAAAWAMYGTVGAPTLLRLLRPTDDISVGVSGR